VLTLVITATPGGVGSAGSIPTRTAEGLLAGWWHAVSASLTPPGSGTRLWADKSRVAALLAATRVAITPPVGVVEAERGVVIGEAADLDVGIGDRARAANVPRRGRNFFTWQARSARATPRAGVSPNSGAS
jgi:hypothetical protein